MPLRSKLEILGLRKRSNRSTLYSEHNLRLNTAGKHREQIILRVQELNRIIGELRSEILKIKDDVAVNNLLQLLVAQEKLDLPLIPEVESPPFAPPVILFNQDSVLRSAFIGFANIFRGQEASAEREKQKRRTARKGLETINQYNKELDDYENRVISDLERILDVYKAILARLKALESFVNQDTSENPQVHEKASDKITTTFTVPFVGRFDVANDVSVGQFIGALKSLSDFNALAASEKGKIPQLVFKIVDSLGHTNDGKPALGNAYWIATYYGLPLNDQISSGTEIARGPIFHTAAVPTRLSREFEILESVPFARAGNAQRDASIAAEILIKTEGAITVQADHITQVLDTVSTRNTNAAAEIRELREQGAHIDMVNYYSSTTGGRALTELLFRKIARKAGTRLQQILDLYFQGHIKDHNELGIALDLLGYGQLELLNAFIRKEISFREAYDSLLAVVPDSLQIGSGEYGDVIDGDTGEVVDVQSSLIVSRQGARTLREMGHAHIDEGTLLAARTIAELLETNFMLGYLSNSEAYALVRQEFGSITSEIAIEQMRVAVQQGKITKFAFKIALNDLILNEQKLSDEHSRGIIEKAKNAIREQVESFEPAKVTAQSSLITSQGDVDE